MGRPEWNLTDLMNSYAASITGSEKWGLRLYQYFKEKMGLKSIILTDLGRQAIYLALKSLHLNASDEVIIPSFVCQNVVLPVIKCGLTPVFADIGHDLNISIDHVIKLINKNTKVIIVPHLYGKAADIEAFELLAKDKQIILIDDAAQAFGGQVNSRFLGTFGQFGIYSFGPLKSMPVARGGALVSNKEKDLSLLRDLKFPSTGHHHQLITGFKVWAKFRMRKFLYPLLNKKKNEAPGNKIKQTRPSKLKQIKPKKMANLYTNLLSRIIWHTEKVIEKRIENARLLSSLLENREPYFCISDDFKHNVFIKFIIVLKTDFQNQREEFISFLHDKGVEAHKGYFPLHLRKAFRQYAVDTLPKTKLLWKGVICLPCDSAMTIADVKYLAESINKYNWSQNERGTQ